MRGRKKEPDGKRITLSFKVSESEAAVIKAAHIGMDRSEWLRLVALAAAGQQPSGTPPAMPPAGLLPRARKTVTQPPCPHRLPSGTYCKTCGHTKT